jgi:excinuclease UvrABC ATPase subunit
MVSDPNTLHNHAVEACKHLEQLATGLSQQGADPAAIKTVTTMAEACRRLVKALASSARQAEPKQSAAAAPAYPGDKPTIDSATNDMMNQARAQRAGQ